MIRGLNEKGNILHRIGNDEEAIKTKLEAIDIAKRSNDQDALSDCLHDLAMIFRDKGDHLAASEYFNESLKISRTLNYPRNVTFGTLNLAYGEKKFGSTNKAIELLEKILKILEGKDFPNEKQEAKRFF